METGRLKQLTRHLDNIVFGRAEISPKNSLLFLEAICAQQDDTACVIKLTSKSAGLNAVQSSMQHRLDSSFFDGHATKFLKFLGSSKIKDLASGTLLHEVVQRIIDPPLFWDHFRKAFHSGVLSNDAQQAFGWLLHYLVSNPSLTATYHDQASAVVDALLSSDDPATSNYGKKIKVILDSWNNPSTQLPAGVPGPGGRHDNDFPDFRQISIAPSAEEMYCTQEPYLRCCAEIDQTPRDSRIASHLDNQFRLLREDMINEMREELQVASGQKKKGLQRGTWVTGLKLSGIDCGIDKRRVNWGLTFTCGDDLPMLKKAKDKDRKKTLEDNPNLLRHQSMSCLFVDGEMVAFPTINRDKDLLAKKPPVIVLQIDNELAARKTLIKLSNAAEIKLLQIDTAIFSYAPILEQLQIITELPLLSELLLWNSSAPVSASPHQPTSLLLALRRNSQGDLQSLLKTPKSIKLDNFQAKSLVSGLSQSVSLIQGPPGTGKSLIGALIAKALYEETGVKILVVCYTNHALDDILTSLLDIGIPPNVMVRMGGKSTSRTEPLMIHKQNSSYKMNAGTYNLIKDLEAKRDAYYDDLQRQFTQYTQTKLTLKDILEHVEFDDPEFFDAFTVPQAGADGLQIVGRNGKAIDSDYLIDRWTKGWNAGVFLREPHIIEAFDIWSMTQTARVEKYEGWKRAILSEQIESLAAVAAKYNTTNDQLAQQRSERDTHILKQKRIIGCTTTAAAKYSKSIQAVAADVLLVEEAGEILESHILTALSSNTRQLVLIGDHKQLRPKVNHYKLTIEKGEGFNLNMSLFERQILKGYPHQALSKQHRMRPEISRLIRTLTYPELSDAPSTLSRSDLRGIQSNIVFISHAHPEDAFGQVADRRDGGSKTSKQNTYEVEMVIKILRYLAQQGYSTDQIVILTPYLGQLHKLRAALRAGKENDPVLNDLDSFDLVKAGLMTQAAADLAKKPIRLATIDNYQGEESDIVIASLTRSNSYHDIGFMVSPERVNVLLSRARDALILLGNADTFTKSKKGGELWTKVFTLMKNGNHVFDGLPAQCQRHPGRRALLRTPDDFELHSPDGGCTEPCGTMLNCGRHACPSKCHQIVDHSKMECHTILRSPCPNGHEQTWKCYQKPPANCRKCERAAEAADAQRKKDYELQKKREDDQRKHEKKMDDLNAQIAQQQQATRDLIAAQERENAIRQAQADLRTLTTRNEEIRNTQLPLPPPSQPQTLAVQPRSNPPPVNPPPVNPSPASPSPALSAPAVKSDPSPTPAPRSTSTPAPPPQLSTKPNATTPQASSPPPPSAVNSPSSGPSSTTPLVPKRSTHTPKIIPPVPPSKSELDWDREKELSGTNNVAIDSIMRMTGLEKVKSSILELKSAIETKVRQGVSSKHMRLNVAFLGNPGTGKTTIARHYAKFLASIQAIPSDHFEETRGADLANDGVSGAKKLLEKVLKAGGGTIFIDEAYQLTGAHNFQGKQVLDYLLAEMENNTGKIVFIVAGYNKEMESFFEHNPGLKSRVPTSFLFEDYNDSELLTMFKSAMQRRYQGRMKVDDGLDGLYVRIAIRRLGRGRGRAGFGNARDLENMIDKIDRHQANRLREERRNGIPTDDLLLCAQDIIGPRPEDALKKSVAWDKLHKMIGLKAVKDSIINLTSIVDINYGRELEEKEPIQLSLNRILLGSPGTGKTTVAGLYGQILADLRIISNGEVIAKNPADFIGSALGQSEQNTKAILATTVGKVLIIDEAYMLYGGGGVGAGGINDPYKTAVIDTIVAEVHNKPGDDRCVLLLGYKDKMMEMFQNVNEGLSRRFAIEDPFNFEDFDNNQLLQILEKKLGEQDIDASDLAKQVAIELLDRSRNRPNFGNAGEVENLLSAAKLRYQARTANQRPRSYDIILEPEDFDPEFDRAAKSTDNLRELFKDTVGFDDLVGQLENYQRIVQVMKQRGMDYRDFVPFNFVFKGPPGTGKTTVARKMGRVYYDMGILSTADVEECSASDLVAQFVGQTGPKTKKLLEKALGKVLFIDEAYRLSEGNFAKEAMDELVGLLTQEKFKGKLIVILAGYDKEMNELLSVNPGLASRFPEQIMFSAMPPERCIELLQKQILKKKVIIPGLDSPLSSVYQEMVVTFRELSKLSSWGNARDVITLSVNMVKQAFLTTADAPPSVGTAENVQLSSDAAIQILQNMYQEQWSRCNTMPSNNRNRFSGLPMQTDSVKPSAPKINIGTRTETAPKLEEEEPEAKSGYNDGRDPGVSDEIWNELQRCKKEEEERQRREEEEAARQKREAEEQAERARKQEEEVKRVQEAIQRAKDEQKRRELERKLEQERLRAAEARRRAAELEKKRRQEEERRQKEREREAKAQAELRRMGVCPAGYQWIKVPGGYRGAKDEQKRLELIKKLEVERLRAAAARERAAELERKRREEEERRQKQKEREAKAQAALRDMGICPAGYLGVTDVLPVVAL